MHTYNITAVRYYLECDQNIFQFSTLCQTNRPKDETNNEERRPKRKKKEGIVWKNGKLPCRQSCETKTFIYICLRSIQRLNQRF